MPLGRDRIGSSEDGIHWIDELPLGGGPGFLAIASSGSTAVAVGHGLLLARVPPPQAPRLRLTR